MRGVFLAALVAAVLAGGPARAIYFSEHEGVARLRGTIEVGDDAVFKAFLEQPRAVPLRLLYLNSEGGQIREGVAIARMIRKAKLDTVVEARSSICESACTMLFAAGIRRYNIGGDTIFEGTSSLSGLGYHPAWQRGDRVRWSALSSKGLDQMKALYREMGQPGAADLCDKASINTLWHPSGATTLQLGIATSLKAPEETVRQAAGDKPRALKRRGGSDDEPVGNR